MFRLILWIQLYRLVQLIFSTSLKGIIRKNANHLQTTDTLKRHQRYSIHYHCGWPSLGIWCQPHTMAFQRYQSHSCVPVVCTGLKKIKAAESFLRACGLHRVCTRLKKNQSSRTVLWCSGFYVFNFIDWCNLFFFMLLNLIKGNPSVVGHFPAVDIKVHDAGETVWGGLNLGETVMSMDRKMLTIIKTVGSVHRSFQKLHQHGQVLMRRIQKYSGP